MWCSTTFSVAANGSAFVASLPSSSYDAGILHGEVYGIVAASIIAQSLPHPHIFSDHLNSVNLLSSSPSLFSLRNNPACSLYRWLVNLHTSSNSAPTITHVCAHTANTNIHFDLNQLVDRLASASQHLPLPPPSVPIPTFFMDNFMLYSSINGFVESHIPSLVNSLIAKHNIQSLDTCHEPLPSLLFFDNSPPPAYPYMKTPSSYSAVIQLYARSGQLDTAYNLANCLGDIHQPWCHFGCLCPEEPHHIFVQCHCHMLYFHQVQFPTSQLFWCIPHLQPIPDSTPYKSFIFRSFKLCLSFYLSFHCSLTFLSTLFCSSFWPPPVLFFDHSLYLAYLFIILCLCMWFSLCLATSFILFPLNVARDILCVSFTPISVVMTTLYISDSIYIVIVFGSSLACNWCYLMLIDVLWHLLALTWHWLNFVELNLLPCFSLSSVSLLIPRPHTLLNQLQLHSALFLTHPPILHPWFSTYELWLSVPSPTFSKF